MIPIQCHSPTENRKLSHRVWRDVRLGKVVKWSESHSVVSDSLWPHRLHSPWNSPGQNTGGGNLSLLQGIFPTQGLNPGLLHCRQILYQLSYKGSPEESKVQRDWVVQIHKASSCYNWSQDPECELWSLLICVWILISTVLLCDKYLWAAISSSAKLDR